jgi:hypothetical protein
VEHHLNVDPGRDRVIDVGPDSRTVPYLARELR